MDVQKLNMVFEEAVAYTTGSEIDIIELARNGVSKKSLLKLAELCSISVKELSRLLPVSERTIQRYDENEKFNPDVSEHLILIAQVLLRAEDVFSNKEKAGNWLQSPLASLSNKAPLSLLDTSFGSHMVMDELGRLEHGVYS